MKTLPEGRRLHLLSLSPRALEYRQPETFPRFNITFYLGIQKLGAKTRYVAPSH